MKLPKIRFPHLPLHKHAFLERTEQVNHICYLGAVAFGHHGLHVLAAGSLALILCLSLAASLYRAS